ncbi:homocitrate synthase/isopropylmalate synthase family protein [Plesiocystis pacifica]|uniref:homocitrate synthase/isopropylmalate synthase family protein n=1 Tax=Plesiocystis pacifica TaxID=191768 RepID=UPI000312D62E|nr:hypothetical protein [Plesiocystis pacifica]
MDLDQSHLNEVRAALAPVRLVDSTLREGLQSDTRPVDSARKLDIAALLAAFGVDCIEVGNPVSSERARADARRLAGLDLGSTRVLAHVRCHPEDIRAAVDTGVDGLNLFIPCSPLLRHASLGRSLDELIEIAVGALELARALRPELELRITPEDSFRTPVPELERFCGAVTSRVRVDRVGLADTVGVAHPRAVEARFARLRQRFDLDLEFHGHNDTGCAVANALLAREAGATHVDVTVLGLGERNGITALEGFVAALLVHDPDAVHGRLRLELLPLLTRAVADAFGVEIPRNSCLVGANSFAHKAGVHTNAMLRDRRSYEFVDPQLMGVERRLLAGHEMTGASVLGARAQALGLDLSPEQLRRLAASVRTSASHGALASETIDELLLASVCAPERAQGL